MISAGRSVPVVSSGLVPSQTVSCRLRPSSTVPVIRCFMLVLLERRAQSKSTQV
jgi:hypothetical protein